MADDDYEEEFATEEDEIFNDDEEQEDLDEENESYSPEEEGFMKGYKEAAKKKIIEDEEEI